MFCKSFEGASPKGAIIHTLVVWIKAGEKVVTRLGPFFRAKNEQICVDNGFKQVSGQLIAQRHY